MNNILSMKTKYIGLLIILLTVLMACQKDDYVIAEPVIEDTPVSSPSPTFSMGSADFSTFVSVGSSITAGYSDGALFAKGQGVAFSNILAQQFTLVGGGEFTQPLIGDDIGGLLADGQQIVDVRRIFDLTNQEPIFIDGSPTTDITNIIAGPYNNMGVPGAKSFHLLAPGYGSYANFPDAANPYFIRMASAPDARVIDDAMAMSPTFFSFWIGNNDVLGYARNGGDGSDPITEKATFDFALTTLVEAMTSSGAKGIITNIPDVAKLPYFTTVPFAPLDPTNPDFGPQIPTLNGIFGQLNQVYAFLEMPERSIVFSQSAASAVVIKDETLVDIGDQIAAVLNGSPAFPLFVQQFGLPVEAAPAVASLLGSIYGQTRQANENDLLVLPSSNVIGTVNADVVAFLLTQNLPEALAGQFAVEGITHPLEDKWVLLPSEQEEIATAIADFNTTIQNLATQNDIAFFDVNTFFNGLATNGFQAGSAFITADYVTGGTFSLDGIHPSPRGNAVIANQIIGLINAKYGSTIPKVNPVDYTGLYID